MPVRLVQQLLKAQLIAKSDKPRAFPHGTIASTAD